MSGLLSSASRKPLPPPQTIIPQGFVLDDENEFRRYKWHDLCSSSVPIESVRSLSSVVRGTDGAVGSGVQKGRRSHSRRGEGELGPETTIYRGFSGSPKISMTQMTFLRKLSKMKGPHFPAPGFTKNE